MTMLVPSQGMLRKARNRRYAVGAFNISNLELLQAVIEAASSQRSPVIIQTSESGIAYGGIKTLAAMTAIAAEDAKIPVALHLDHGQSLESVRAALRNGYTSVMIDASHLSFEQNIAATKKAVRIASPKGVTVEAELGTIGGREDYVKGRIHYTEPSLARQFVDETGVDVLAVAVGTSHGAYKFAAHTRHKLDVKRLAEISRLVKIPLALHGASGVYRDTVRKAIRYGAQLGTTTGNSDAELRTAIGLGISKINTDTDLRIAFTAELRKFLVNHPPALDPREMLGAARQGVREMATRRIKLFGSSGKA